MTNKFEQQLDPLHKQIKLFHEPFSYSIWWDKYRWSDEKSPEDMCARVAQAINTLDGDLHVQDAYDAMIAGLWMPAGRILAGAGTGKRVTLVNCFVNAKMRDEMEHIMDCLKYTALTMQQGGGMGTNFSTLRPANAILKRTWSKASGPLPFMDQMNATSRTIRSAGDRRGAMMGTMCDTHPDLPTFIMAKQTAGRLSEFNVSVLVSDAFMEAIQDDEEWLLYFSIPPFERRPELENFDFYDEDGVMQYVYSVWRARDLWALITKNTYEYSEPGIIFIDRINQLNNLKGLEEISCTNPCGEQPLPPHGACNLGHVNLARMVNNPFTDTAEFNWGLLQKVTRIGQRFLDNVIDITDYPLPEQEAEQKSKRRTGLGIAGLADAMMQLGLRYGSPRSIDFASLVMREVALTSYAMNIELAREKGCAPILDEKYLREALVSNGSFVDLRLDDVMKKHLVESGLRNSVALTIAPTGTTSIVFGNLDGSGCECAFAHSYDRKVRQPPKDGESLDEYKVYKDVKGYTHRLWEVFSKSSEPYPNHFVTSQDLSVEEHIAVQAALQHWVDASVSKTVNVPKEMPYESFAKVYDLAYALGAKGCTTYRPSDIRGSILSTKSSDDPNLPSTLTSIQEIIPKRPEVLHGVTYQIKWPKRAAALYLTINEDDNGFVREILAASKDSSAFEWVTALTLMVTAIFKKGGDVSFVADELKQVQSIADATWMDGKFYGSLVAYIGYLLERHFNKGSKTTSPKINSDKLITQPIGMLSGEPCPSCQAPAVIRKEGCKTCSNCGWSSC